MKAIDLIRWSLQRTEQFTERMAADLRDKPMTRATPGGKGGDGSHALWLLGHLTFIEAGLARIVRGDPHPLEHWAALFAPGTEPSNDRSKYPSFDEVLSKFRELRAANINLLDEIGEAALDRAPAWVPPGFEEVMKTVGQTFVLIAMHNMQHCGQLADVRRVAGLKRFM
jgi:hypothetical protein